MSFVRKGRRVTTASWRLAPAVRGGGAMVVLVIKAKHFLKKTAIECFALTFARTETLRQLLANHFKREREREREKEKEKE
jgi:hypothetical protein